MNFNKRLGFLDRELKLLLFVIMINLCFNYIVVLIKIIIIFWSEFMNDVFGIFIEFILTFIVVYLIYYFVIIRKNKEFDPNRVPVEVNLIIMRHKIDMKKIDYGKMLRLISLVSSLDIALIVTMVFRFVDNVYLGIFVSLLIVIPISLIGYSAIGRYFEKNSLKK